MSDIENVAAGDANRVLYRNALLAFERYMDLGLYHKGDKLYPKLAVKVIEHAREEAKRNDGSI